MAALLSALFDGSGLFSSANLNLAPSSPVSHSMLESLFLGNGCWLGLILGTFKVIGRGLVAPFQCDSDDRPVVAALWILMLGCLSAGIFYFAAPLAKTETMGYVAAAALLVGVVLLVVVGGWGKSLEELGDEFEDPYEGHPRNSPWSGTG